MSDMDRILKLAGLATNSVAEKTVNEESCGCCGNTPCDCGDDCGCKEVEENTAREMKDVGEAVGEFAAPIYDLIDEYGVENVIDDLIRYMSGDDIEDFVADFRRHNDQGIDEAEIDENAFNQAAADAARKGEPHFEFNGKKYKTKMDKETAHKLDDDIQESQWCGVCGNDVCTCPDDAVTEGGYKDQIIDDAQSMDLEDFIEKHEGYGMDREECIEQWKYINGVKESEEISEAPTMDTTQLITLLKNAGLTEEAIEAKLNEWANTPEGVGEVEPTSHGDAYEMAQAVNLSLKRYLNAEDSKVQVSESHTIEGMKEAYKAKKNK